MWRPVADVQRAAVGRHVDRARACDPEAEALDVTALLDVWERARSVEGAEQRVLGPDRGDVEGRRHERPVHHDRRADAVDARGVHDPLVVDGDRLRAALPGGVDDVGEIGRVTDRFVDGARRHADVAGVIELYDDAVTALRG